MLDLQSTVVKLLRELQALLLPGHEDHDQPQEAGSQEERLKPGSGSQEQGIGTGAGAAAMADAEQHASRSEALHRPCTEGASLRTEKWTRVIAVNQVSSFTGGRPTTVAMPPCVSRACRLGCDA